LQGRSEISLGKKTFSMKIISEKKINVSEAFKDESQKVILTAIMNVIFQKILRDAGLVRFGRNNFVTENIDERWKKKGTSLTISSDENVTVYPGFATEVSLKKGAGNKIEFWVNIDTVSKVISRLTVLQKLYNICDYDNWSQKSQQRASSELRNQIVFTSYNNRTWTIEDVVWTKTLKDTFELDKGSKTTYYQYFIDKWGLTAKDNLQPLLKTSIGSRVVYLVPEFCLITDIDDFSRRKLPKLCSVKPEDRYKKINELVTELSSSKNLFPNFNLSLDSKFENMNSRSSSLPYPTMYMPGVGKFLPNKNWRDKKVDFSAYKYKPGPLNVYVIFEDSEFARKTKDSYIRDISNDLTAASAPIKFQNIINIPVRPPNSFISSLNSTRLQEPLLILGFINERSKNPDYNEIKQFCMARGHLSQCISISPHSEQKRRQGKMRNIVYNITKQVINKFGYLCFWPDGLTTDVAPSLKGKKVLLVGVDVYHSQRVFQSAKGYTQRRSLAGFVGVLINERGGMRCSSSICPQEARQEIVGNKEKKGEKQQSGVPKQVLEKPTISRDSEPLHTFLMQTMRAHKFKPDVVIVWRDGVAETMIEDTKKHELSQISKALPDAKVIFTLVQKRIHARFVVQARDGRVGNPAPGIVVNDLSPTYPDFYLVPTSCNLSTVNPVRYVIVKDDKVMPLAEFQKLTYTMCFCYPNWTDSVKLPSPTQCAHKLAFLVGEIKAKDPTLNERLIKKYWYL